MAYDHTYRISSDSSFTNRRFSPKQNAALSRPQVHLEDLDLGNLKNCPSKPHG